MGAPNLLQKYHEHGKVKGTPYMFYYYLQVPNFNPFRSMARSFVLQALLWQVYPGMTPPPPMTLNITRLKGAPYISYYYSGVPDFNSFRYDDPIFELHAILRELHQMTQKITLNTAKSKVPHVCPTTISESTISKHFSLYPAVFVLQAILKPVHRMTPKWHWTLQG